MKACHDTATENLSKELEHKTAEQIDELLSFAEQNNTDALLELGLRYKSHNKGVEHSDEQAKKYFAKGKNLGDNHCAYNYALLCDAETRDAILDDLAEKDYMPALAKIAHILYFDDKEELAVPYWKRAAKLGDGESTYRLAAYYSDCGVEPNKNADPEKFMYYLELGHKLGYDNSTFWLLQKKLDVDRERALELTQYLADRGKHNYKAMLAEFYEYGKYVPTDIEKAINMYYNICQELSNEKELNYIFEKCLRGFHRIYFSVFTELFVKIEIIEKFIELEIAESVEEFLRCVEQIKDVMEQDMEKIKEAYDKLEESRKCERQWYADEMNARKKIK